MTLTFRTCLSVSPASLHSHRPPQAEVFPSQSRRALSFVPEQLCPCPHSFTGAGWEDGGTGLLIYTSPSLTTPGM